MDRPAVASHGGRSVVPRDSGETPALVMTPIKCLERAERCEAKALLANSEDSRINFLALAAQWRLIAKDEPTSLFWKPL